MVDSDGAGSPQMLQKRAVERFICPHGHGRSVPDRLLLVLELGGIGELNEDGAPNAAMPSSSGGAAGEIGTALDDDCAIAGLPDGFLPRRLWTATRITTRMTIPPTPTIVHI